MIEIRNKQVSNFIRLSDIPEGTAFTGSIGNTRGLFIYFGGPILACARIGDGVQATYTYTLNTLVTDYKPVDLIIEVVNK